jgi:CubicO group peptidase (beta-lactamase class C family)
MNVEPEKAGLSRDRLKRITAHLERNFIEPGKIAGCQALVARRGQVAYFRSFGMMDRERAIPMRDDTIFRIFSMTKPITSVALMSLYEQGHFQLNDPVHRFIPEWRDLRVYVSGEGEHIETREPVRPLTFRHILSHTGGISYGMTNHPADRVYRAVGATRQRDTTLKDFVERLAQVPLRFDPGDRWMYSAARRPRSSSGTWNRVSVMPSGSKMRVRKNSSSDWPDTTSTTRPRMSVE